MSYRFLLILIFSAITVGSLAQTWTESNGPFGGTPQDYLIDGSGNILAATCGGIFRSTNGGTSWTRTKVSGGDLGYNDCLFDLLQDGTTFYALSGNTIFTSTDGGLNWGRIKKDDFIGSKRLAKNPVSGNFFIAANLGVYRSTDQGLSITKEFAILDREVLDIAIKSNGDIFAATSDGVYKSPGASDGAAGSWTRISTGINGSIYCYSIAIDGTGQLYVATGDNLYKSTDNGSIWTSIKGALTQTSFRGQLRISPTTNTLFHLNLNYGVINKTTDAGGNWSTINPPSGYYFQGNLMVVDDNILYAVHYDKGVLKTINGGTSWTLYNQGLTAQNAADIMLADNGSILLLPYFGIVRSADDGVTWTTNEASPADGNFDDFLKLTNGTILAIGTKEIKTTDGGATWTLVNGTLPSHLRCIVTANESTFYSLGDDEKIYSSTNQGTNWNEVTISGLPGSYDGIDLVVAQNGNLYFLVHESGARQIYKITAGAATLVTKPTPFVDGIEITGNDLLSYEWGSLYKSSDAGATWASVFPGTFFNHVSKASSGELLSFGYGLAISKNAGKQWNYASVAPQQEYIDQVATVNSTGIVYAKSSATGLLKTSAAPVPTSPVAVSSYNWQHLPGPYGGYIFKMEKDAAGNIYGGQRDIFKLPVGSSTWQKTTNTFDFFVYDFTVGTGNRLIAVANDRIRFSTDGGTTWTEPVYNQNQRFNGAYIVRESGTNLWVAGDKGLWLSTDNGVNWLYERGAKVYRMEVNSSGHVYIITGLGIEKSIDSGANWVIANNGITEFPTQASGSPWPNLAIDGSGNVFCTVPTNIYKTTNGGSNWTSVKGTIDTAGGVIDWMSAQGTSVFIGLSNNKLYRSADQGATWTLVTLPTSNGVSSLAVDGSTIFLNDRNALLENMFKSPDGGSTWSKIPTGITASDLGDIDVTLTGRILAGDYGCGFIASNDAGATWYFPTGTGGGVGRFLTLTDGTVLTYGCSLGKSTDNGATWTAVGTQSTFSVIRVQNDNIWFKWETDNGKFYKSINQGGNWTEIVITGMTAASNAIRQFDVDSNGNMFVLVEAAFNRDLYKVTNSVATKLNPSGQSKSYAFYYNVKVFNNKIYVPGEWFGKNLYSSEDGGITWSTTRMPQTDNFIIDRNGYFFALKNDERKLYVSYNAGVTWQDISEPGASFTDVMIDRTGYAYGVTNNSGILKSNGIVMPTDAVAPIISSLLPADNAVDVVVSSTIEITLNEFTKPVAGKKLKIYLGSSTTPAFDVDVATLLQKENRYFYDPPTDLKFNKNYHVEIEAGAFVDIFGNAFAGISNGTDWSFKIVKDPDSPVITHTPANIVRGSSAAGMSVNITDVSDIGMVKIFYKGIMATSFQSPTSLNAVAGSQDFSVPSSAYDAMGLEYYFEATDEGGNTGTSNHYYSYVSTQTANAIEIPNLKFGGSVNDWKMISIPHKLTDPSILSVFDELLPANIEKWRLINYKRKDEWNEFPANFSTIDRGKGYFINIKDVTTVKVTNADTPNNNQADLFSLNLVAGWNQIGNPYTARIDWPNVLSYNLNAGVNITGVATQITKYSSGYNQDENFLRPFEGAFVRSDAAVTLKVPLTGNTAGRMAEPFSSELEEDNWKIDFVVRQGEFTYSMGAVGMHPEAKTGKDKFDEITPPRFFNYLEFNSNHPEYFMPKFTKDIVASSNQYVWNFEIETENNGTTEIGWNHDPLATSTVPVYLVDKEAVVVIDMRKQNQYVFDLRSHNRKLELYYGREPVFSSFGIGQPWPNPFNGLVSIPVSLPERVEPYEVKVEVHNSLGQRIGVVASGQYKSGYHRLTWDGKDADGQELPSQLYFVNVLIDSGSQLKKESCKVIKN